MRVAARTFRASKRQVQYGGALSPLQLNLAQEIAMADWLETNLQSTTIKFAGLKEAGETAKV